MSKMPKESPDLVEERKNALKRLMPEVFTEGKLDLNKLKEALGEAVETSGERYTFSWAGRIQSIRTRDKRSKATLVPSRKESLNFDETKNVFIEGENLEVLKILQKAYEGKVKMIYIDPPYNTGNDFVYKDDFSDSLKNYLKYTGQTNGNGEKTTTNPETSGRYHSNWLSMMYPRLFLARNLLSEDGVIFVSIDDNEVHNLRMIMNEIFGQECFKNCIIFRRGIKSVQAQFETIDSLTVGHEYILLYAKSSETRFKHFKIVLDEAKEGTWNNHWRGTDRPTMRYALFGITPEKGQWRWSEERSLKAIENYARMLCELGIKKGQEPTQEQIDAWYAKEHEKGEELDLLRLSKNNKPEHYIPPSETKLGSDMWVDLSPRGSSEVESVLGKGYFDNPKPVDLIKRMIQFITTPKNGDILLDFFAGSGTVAQAVLEQNVEDGGNRKFILVQLPEPTLEDSEARKAGYKTIADICKERIRRVIKKIKDEQNQQKQEGKRNLDLGFKVLKLSKSNCFVWDSEETKDQTTLIKHIEESAKGASKADSDALVFESMLREGFKLDSEIQKTKQGKNEFYKVSDGEHALWMCFDGEIDDEAVKKLGLAKDDKLIVLDSSLSDTQKVNLARKFRVETI